ncbi:hypothetical protein B5F79_07410 [Olsenella sp. An285]|uniref:S-layer homology domain-containing protein n=1 Tax=Olsenella sp. An285 TaxID=1965621 RepID=UPI000B393F3A|nr:hypothetical protein B5F79_07410 [Olsenella sp. An285]
MAPRGRARGRRRPLRLRWAVSEGVLRGTGEGLLEPGRAVTRAEMAAILMRLVTVS